MARINLVAPWDEYYNKMAAFFKEDYDVTVLYDDQEDDTKRIKVLVDNPEKATALEALLNKEKDFGGVKLIITVVPADDVPKSIARDISQWEEDSKYYNLYRSALIGNANFAKVQEIKGMLGFDATFVVFKKKVIQYYNDNIGDLNGVMSTLAEYIARDIFIQNSGVFFNTDIKDINQLNCREDYTNRYNELAANPF